MKVNLFDERDDLGLRGRLSRSHDFLLDLGELGDRGIVHIEMGFHKLRRYQGEPLVQRDILELAWNGR